MSTKRWKKGYKIVCRNTHLSKWVSVISMTSVEYSVNKITKRPLGGGPLCVFKNFKDADEFNNSDDFIFECKYKESDDDKIWHPRHEEGARICLVKGKVLADEVKLVKRVNIREMRKSLKKSN